MMKSDDGWDNEMNDNEYEYYAKGPSSRDKIGLVQAAARMKRGNQ
jgi:hypothetical protein